MKTLERYLLIPLLLTVNILQTLFYLLTLNKQTFAGFILKIKTLLKTRSGIPCVILLCFKCELILLPITFELISSQPYKRISQKFLPRSLLQTLIQAKKMLLIFKMTSLQIHLPYYRFCLLED